MNIVRLLLAAVISAGLLSGCAVFDTRDILHESDTSQSETSAGSDSYYYKWQGEPITAETARENGCLMLGESGADGSEWQGFLIDLESSAQAVVTVCTENSVMLVSEDDTGDTATIQIKEKDGDRVVAKGRLISPARVCCVRSEDSGCLEYYLSDCLIYTVPAEGEVGYSSVPAEFGSYEVSPDAALTFPYQKCFPSYSDFFSYYEQYNDLLGLDKLKSDMETYDAEGGFNTHIVFLYGDISGGDTQYEFLRASKDGGQLFIYLRRVLSDGTGSVSKWQLTCTVPSEYLSDVAPDAVTWVIYDDTETRS